MEEYADSVHEIQALEDLRLEYQEVSLSDFEEEMVSQLSVIDKQTSKKICVSSELPQQTVVLSTAAVFRITENIFPMPCDTVKKKLKQTFPFHSRFLSL